MDTKTLFEQRSQVRQELDDVITALYLAPNFRDVYLSLATSLRYQLSVLDSEIDNLVVEFINI